MTQVYVLLGQTGEYSDRSEWVVRAYTNKDDADADAMAMNAIGAEGVDALYGRDREAVIERLRMHDTQADMDYTGTSYFVAAVPLVTTAQVEAA